MKLKTLVIIPMVLTLFSCQEVEKSQTKKSSNLIEKNVSTKKSLLETDKEFSQRLARVGEILINNPVGFAHADELFKQALVLDPQNNKALLYSSLTEIVMTLRGTIKRGEGLFDKKEDYDNLVNHVTKEMKYPEFIDFVIGTKNDQSFKNYQDIKRFFQNDVVNAFENAQTKLNKIDGNVEMILTQLKSKNTEIEYNCVEESVEGETFTNCELKEEMDELIALPAKTATIDEKDIKILAGGLKAYAVALKVITAYGIEGQLEITKAINAKSEELGRALTEKEVHLIAKQYSNYLVLEKDHRLSEVIRDLESVVINAMDLESLNNQFCDNDLREHNLIKVICFDDNAREELEKVLAQLAGPQEVVIGLDENGDDVKILTDLPSFLNNPVQDLKNIMPDSYNSDGTANYTIEPELNGLFPNKDLLEKYKAVKYSDDE